MITQEFNLNLHAGHSIPLVIYVSQYEKNEQWLFTIINQDGTQYRPASASIVGTKSDGNLITNEATVDSNGRVVVEVTEQIAAAAGKAVFELRLDDQQHGTANFVVLVEKSPADGGVPSESDLSLIQRAIDGTSATAIAQGVGDWMDENLTPTTPVVDQSLTVQGAAADSKKVGDELNDLKSHLTDVTEPIDNLIDWSLLQIGKNWSGGSASNRAVLYWKVKPNTTYFCSLPSSTVFDGVVAIEKAGNAGSYPILTSTTINSGQSAKFTTTENTQYVCFQFVGNRELVESDFNSYEMYFREGDEPLYTMVDKLARRSTGVSDFETMYDLAVSRDTGFMRVGGYEVRNLVAYPYALDINQDAHENPYYDVNGTIKEVTHVRY